MLAFIAARGFLREAGEDPWSAIGLPFVVMGSTLYALLPAMEFTPLGAHAAGADVAAAQAALMPWFRPILLIGALFFAVGALGFAIGIPRSRLLSPRLARLVAVALLIMAAARFFPIGAAQLYLGPAAGVVALWALAYVIWTRRAVPSPERTGSVTSS